MEKIKFNLSPSAINCYNNSQIDFYYTYIIKAQPDTKPFTCYGNSGNVVHNILEAYTTDKSYNLLENFDKLWDKYHLNTDLGLNDKPLNKSDYLKAMLNGKRLLDSKYFNSKPEEKIEFDYINNDNFEIKFKGIIDLPCYDKDGNFLIVDWKTKTSVDHEGCFIQARHYAWSYWKKYNTLPQKVIFEYVKIGKEDPYIFDKIDMIRHEDYLNNLAHEIMEKGTDISKYEIGDYNTPFCVHKIKIRQEQQKREFEKDRKINTIKFMLKIKNNKVYILNKISDLLKKMLIKQFSYEDSNITWIRKSGSNWDGVYRLYNEKKQYIMRGHLDRLLRILEKYCDYKNMEFNYQLIEDDKYNPKVRRDDFNDKLININLREEQEESTAVMMVKMWGRVKLPTGTGKTVMAAEFIRQHRVRTLFIVDTLDLLLQARKELSETLGMSIGIIGGGEFQEDFITVATWQSLIKKCDNQFFDRQQCIILDECQIGASKSIKTILSKCVSTHYRLGLSATPIHKEHDLQIEGMLGDIVYNLETKDAQDKGYLVDADVRFYHVPINSEEYDWRSDYDYNIVQHPIRNKMVVDYVTERADLGETSIILTKSIEHGKLLSDMIPNSFHIHGSINKNIRQEKWDELRNNNIFVIIATLKIASKGLNVKNLRNIVNASANGNGDDSIQSLGRVLRLFDEKTHGVYMDFFDAGKYCKQWSRIRFRALKNEGHDIKTISYEKQNI